MQTIGYTLESFFRQTHYDKELVIIDGGSTDDTLDIVTSFPQDKVTLISEPDQGMYDAANKGLRLYTGDAVGMLNSDDRYHDHRVLEDIAAALDKAQMVSGNLDFVRDHATHEILRRWRGTAYWKGAFRRGWMPPHPTFYVRREVAQVIGEFDLKFRTAADYDWMLRAYEVHSFSSEFLDRVMVDMKIGGKSTSSVSSHLRHNFEALQSRRLRLGTAAVDYALLAKPLGKIHQIAFSYFLKDQRSEILPDKQQILIKRNRGRGHNNG
jgi:glycosyltransferase involved in cell wall biosynthesis